MHTASVAVHTGASVAAVVVAICILQFVALLRNPIGVVAVGVVAVVAAVAAAVVDFDPVVGCTTTRVGAASYRFPPRRSSSRQSAARSLYYSLVPILSCPCWWRPSTITAPLHIIIGEASIISSTEHSIFLNSKENEALSRQTAEFHLRALMRLTKLPKNSY